MGFFPQLHVLKFSLEMEVGKKEYSCPSGVDVAKEESFMGKGSKMCPASSGLRIKKGNGSGGKVKLSFLLPSS